MKHIFCIRTFCLVGFLLVMVIGVKAQTLDWKWQNPLPTGYRLYDFQFLDNQIGWAVGGNGTIIKTVNGGQTWQTQVSGSTTYLYSVYFTDALNGWTVGYYGVILKTNNGGLTWQAQISGTSKYLIDVHFINAQTGWAVGQNGIILKTINGGQTWQIQSSVTSYQLESVYFIDSQTGWATGENGHILKTINGGQSWQIQVSGTTNSIYSIHFADLQSGYAVGHSGTILKTVNGGQTWQNQSISSPNFIHSVHCINAQNAWAVGEYGTFLRTTNGGQSWIPQTHVTEYNIYSVRFLNAQTGWVMGDYGTILRTDDGGSSWQMQNSTNLALHSVHFANSETGWAVGDYGTILKTNNRGQNWSLQSNSNDIGFIDVYFVNTQIGWAVGEGGTIFKTSNGGQLWQVQNSNTSQGLFSVHFIDSLNGWIANGDGHILKTTDGGGIWQSFSSGTSNMLLSIYFIDLLTGWAVGQSGTILKTTNGGENWQVQSSGVLPTLYLTSVQFIDAQTGWVVGQAGKILKTSNGGQTWQAQNSGTLQEFSCVYFIDDQIGWVVGLEGTILTTTNGGQTWQAQSNGASLNNLLGVHFADAQTGWAVGDGGAILTTLTNNYVDSDSNSSLLQGKLFEKTGSGCAPGSVPIAHRLITATPGPYYGLSNSKGDYQFRLPIGNTPRNYILEAKPFNSIIYQANVVCPPTNVYNITLDTIPDTLSGKDFGFEITNCQHLDVQIASNRRRRCFRNTTSIFYINQGSITAPDAFILVEFPQWVKPISASAPHLALNDSTWRFEIGTVQPGTGGNITIIDSVLCSAPINLTQCTKATIYPAPDCPPPSGWNGAQVTVSGECHNGNVELGIYNPTTHDMTDSVDYWVYLDSIQVRTGKVKLLAGDSLKMNAEAFGMTVTLTARQVSSHPTEVFVTTTIEACDDTTIYIPRTTANHFPKVQTPNSKTHCLPIRTSYDPNDKQAFPIGFTSNHIVKPGTEMEYLVRFQNTGNDTAFTVYVVDSLDNNLNPETIELGAASHPYEISMQTTRQGRTYLRWQFDNINLPDSNVNELKSHGFFQYRISPKPGIALGTQARNEASIYFDFNPPVLTNQTLTTFDNLVFTNPALNPLVLVVVPTQTALTGTQIGVKLYPNPVTQNQLTASFATKGSLFLYDSKGQVVFQKENIEGIQTIPVRLKSGFYFARISTERGSSTEKVIVLE